MDPEELQERIDSQEQVTQDVDAQLQESQETVAHQKSFKELFAEKGFAVEDLDDASLADQLAQRLQSQIAIERELEELRRAKAELERFQATQPPAQQERAQEPTAESDAQKQLRRWQKVDLDPELKVACEYDQESGAWRGKDKFGSVGMEAARKLNDAAKEQQRRASLMVNDPVSALEEAGFLDIIEERLRTTTEKVREEVVARIEQEKRSSVEQMKMAARNRDADQFFEENKSKFFHINEQGLPKKGLDGQFLLTDFGNQVRDLASQFQQDGIKDHAVALRRATEVCSRFSQQQVQAKPENKKEAFLEKARQVATEAKSPAPIQAPSDVVPRTPGRRKFLEYVLTDPDNAEALGEHYRGN